jgi:valyl-tRNA synthetase
LNKTARDVNAQLEQYDFHGVVQTLYHFFWDDFCDWYIELSKATVTSEEESPERSTARARLISVLEQSLRLLHPFMPYLTEELWQKLPVTHSQLLHPAYAGAEPTIMLASFPQCNDGLVDEIAEAEMSRLTILISCVRNIRSEINVKPGDRISILIGEATPSVRAVYEANRGQIERLARIANLSIEAKLDAPKASARAVLSGTGEVAVPLEGLVNFAQERVRLTLKKDNLQKEATKLNAQLGNSDFVARAPAEKVSALKARADEIALHTVALDQMIEAIK